GRVRKSEHPGGDAGPAGCDRRRECARATARHHPCRKQVNFTVSAIPATTFEGSVSTISPTVNPQTRTVQIQIQPTNDQGRLRGGMLANVGIVTASAREVLT